MKEVVEFWERCNSYSHYRKSQFFTVSFSVNFERGSGWHKSKNFGEIKTWYNLLPWGICSLGEVPRY